MSFAELEGWLAALRAVRRPPGRFSRRLGRGAADDSTVETKTTRSISLRRPRPANSKVKEDSHGS